MHGLNLYDALAAKATAVGSMRSALIAAGLAVPGGLHVGAAPQGNAAPALILGDDTEAEGLIRDKTARSAELTTTARAYAPALRTARKIAEAWATEIVAAPPTVAGAQVLRVDLDASFSLGRDPDPNAPAAFGWAVRLRHTLIPN